MPVAGAAIVWPVDNCWCGLNRAGDLLQMARCLPLLKSQKQAQSLTVCCPKSLVRLFTRIPGVDSIVDTDSPLPDYELHCSFMDLPALFGTRLENIPAAIPYLTPEPSDINKLAGAVW